MCVFAAAFCHLPCKTSQENVCLWMRLCVCVRLCLSYVPFPLINMHGGCNEAEESKIMKEGDDATGCSNAV